MFAGTIRDNILFGIKREVTDEELERVCTDAEIGYDRIPTTYEQAKRMDSWYLRQEEPKNRAKVRERLLMASKEDLKNKSQVLKRFGEDGTVCVLGNKERIKEAEDQFDSVTALIE